MKRGLLTFIGVLRKDLPWDRAHSRDCRAMHFPSPGPVDLVSSPFFGMERHHLKWTRLRDSSVCLIDELSRVTLPYCIFRHIGVTHVDGLSDAECAFQEALRYLVDKVDVNLFAPNCLPWQHWEVFGACFIALCVNGLLLGVATCALTRVLGGARFGEGCDFMVKLRPMRVGSTSHQLSADSSATVPMTGEGTERNWVRDGVVLLNRRMEKALTRASLAVMYCWF